MSASGNKYGAVYGGSATVCHNAGFSAHFRSGPAALAEQNARAKDNAARYARAQAKAGNLRRAARKRLRALEKAGDYAACARLRDALRASPPNNDDARWAKRHARTLRHLKAQEGGSLGALGAHWDGELARARADAQARSPTPC